MLAARTNARAARRTLALVGSHRGLVGRGSLQALWRLHVAPQPDPKRSLNDTVLIHVNIFGQERLGDWQSALQSFVTSLL